MSPDRLKEQFPARLVRALSAPATRQLLRYVVAGFLVTQFAALVYSAAVSVFRAAPLMANVISTGFGLGAGYCVHSRWTFARGSVEGEGYQAGRFLVASLFAFLINSTWVWLLTTVLRLPPLAPLPLMMFATPWISFLLNRYWVFKIGS